MTISFNSLNHFISRAELKALDLCQNRALKDKYCESHNKTCLIWEQTHPSDEQQIDAEESSISSKVEVLKDYDFAIRFGEDLSLLKCVVESIEVHFFDVEMEIYKNSTIAEIKENLDDVIQFLGDQVIHQTDDSKTVLSQIQQNPELYVLFFLSFINRDREKIDNNPDLFITDNHQVNLDLILSLLNEERSDIDFISKFIHLSISRNPELKNELLLEIARDNKGARALVTLIPDKIEVNESTIKQQLAFEIATHERGAKYLFKHIEEFQFNDDFLPKLAKEITKHKTVGDYILKKLDKEKILDSTIFNCELILGCARHKTLTESLLTLIPEFIPENPEYAKELIVEMTSYPHGAVAIVENLQKFGIDDDTFLNTKFKRKLITQVLKHEEGAAAIAENFGSLQIKDITYIRILLTEIVKYEEGASAVAENFELFPLTDRKEIVDFARKIVQHEDGAISLAENIEKFHFVDQELMKEFAKRIASYEHGADAFIENLQKFQIEDNHFVQKLILEIAQREDRPHTSESILDNLDMIGDPIEFRNRVLLTLTEHEVGAIEVVKKLDEIEGLDETVKKQLVLQIANHPRAAKTLITIFDDLDLEDSVFIKQAAFLMGKNPWVWETLCENLDDFDLYDKAKKLILYMQLDSNHTFRENLLDPLFTRPLFPLTSLWADESEKGDPELSVGIALIEQINRSLETLPLVSADREEFNKNLEIFRKAFAYTAHRCPAEDINRAYKNLIRLARDQKKKAKSLQKDIEALKSLQNTGPNLIKIVESIPLDIYMNRWQFHSVIYFVSSLLLRVNPLDQNLVLGSNIMPCLFNLDDIDIRLDLSHLFFEHATKCSQKKELQRYINHLGPNWATPSKIALLGLSDQGVEVPEQMRSSLVSPPKKKKDPSILYRNRFLSHESRQNLFVKTLINLKENNRLSLEKKSQILTYLTHLSDEELEVELHALNGLLILRREKSILGSEDIHNHQQFFQTVSQIFYELLPDLDITDTDTFEKTFYGHRHPEALPLHVAKLQSLNEDDRTSVLNMVRQLVRDVSTGDFQKNRYLDSEHLRKVFSYGKDFEDKWKRSSSQKLSVYLSKKPKKERQDWRLVICDDPLDLFLSGTEVSGSCQNVARDPKYTKALMGYVMDGKHKILAIKDDEKRIKCRLILRIMWDDKNEKPVLFFETIYPETTTPEYREAMQRYAKEYADELGVDLISLQTSSETPYEGTVKSLSSKAPFEYCDAADGIQEEGTFEISGSYKL